MVKELKRTQNNDLKEIFESGFACHHAGMARADRLFVEKVVFVLNEVVASTGLYCNIIQSFDWRSIVIIGRRLFS